MAAHLEDLEAISSRPLLPSLGSLSSTCTSDKRIYLTLEYTFYASSTTDTELVSV
jgi:hypothetical protein